MRIVQYDGTWIEYDSTDELPEIYELKCTCGHKLSYHAFTVSWGTKTVFPSQCTHCDFTDNGTKFGCEKFRYYLDI